MDPEDRRNWPSPGEKNSVPELVDNRFNCGRKGSTQGIQLPTENEGVDGWWQRVWGGWRI